MKQPILNGHVATIRTGTDANKPSNPGLGDVYLATDTGKTYTCYISSTWSLTSSINIERYSNHLGTTDNIMSTTVTGTGTATSTAATHRMDLYSGITTPGTTKYSMNIGIDPSTTFFTFRAKVQNVVDGSTGGGVDIRTSIGFFGVPDIGAYFFQDAAQAWFAMTNWTDHGATYTPISDIVAGDNLIIVNQINRTVYLVNGIIVANHQTTAAALTTYPQFYISSTQAGVAVAREISCDYIEIEIMR